MSLKQLALKYLPAPILRSIRARRYQSSLRHYSIAAEPDLLGCKALLNPGDIVLDIGANIGVYTRFCSEFVGPAGHVHSLEPVPETYSYLVRNVRSLGLTNVTHYNLAASDQDRSKATMSMPDYATGGPNIYEARISDHGDIPVTTCRIDTLFPKLSPQLIKCDVEGHELAAINGARELIVRSRPRWLIEVSNSETFDLMSSLGYQPFVWLQGSFIPKSPSIKVANYFFFPHENPYPVETRS